MNKKSRRLRMCASVCPAVSGRSVWGNLEREDGCYTLVDGEGHRIARTAHRSEKRGSIFDGR